MATADTQYSPFQQELLANLGQINSNVSSLIDVFMKFQESFSSNRRLLGTPEIPTPHLCQSTSCITPKLKENEESKTPIANGPISRRSSERNGHALLNNNNDQLSSMMPSLSNLLQQSKSMPHDIKPLHVHHTIQEGPNESELVTPIDCKDDDPDPHHNHLETNNGHFDDEPAFISKSEGRMHDEHVMSLDSGDDDDDRNSVHLPLDHDQLNRNQLVHAQSCRTSTKYSGKELLSQLRESGSKPLPSTMSSIERSQTTHGYKGRNKSSSACASSASMADLLRMNQHRRRGYRGKKRSSMLTHSRSRKAPVFNPQHVLLSSNNRVSINVGGNRFQTTLNTLSSDQSSMLSAMFSGRFKLEQDENGSIFIDRDPTHFRHILNFLRDGIEYLKHGGLLQQPEAIVNELLQEAKYYNIRPLVDYIQLQQTRKNKKKGDELTHEKQYKLISNIKLEDLESVFNKYTGSAGYDFEEWLYVSPWKTSRNSTTTPFFVMLFSKKLSRAEVRLLDRLTNIDFQ